MLNGTGPKLFIIHLSLAIPISIRIQTEKWRSKARRICDVAVRAVVQLYQKHTVFNCVSVDLNLIYVYILKYQKEGRNNNKRLYKGHDNKSCLE